MTILRAGQLIYTRLEPHESPGRRDGFQTLYCTRDELTDRDIEEIEERLVYFPATDRPRKRLFCSLTSGRLLVAQVTGEATRDAAGRGGLFLAHALVVSPGEFEQIGNDPFPFFDQTPFVTTRAEAFALGDARSGRIPPRQFDVATLVRPVPTQFSPVASRLAAELAASALACRDAESQSGEIVLVGSCAAVEELLREVWWTLPRAVRPACSFDTGFDLCNRVATRFWVTGLSRLSTRTSARQFVLQAESSAITALLPSACDSRAAFAGYRHWLAARLLEDSPARIARHTDQALVVCERLARGTRLMPERSGESGTPGPVDRTVSREVCVANLSFVRQRLVEQLQLSFPPAPRKPAWWVFNHWSGTVATSSGRGVRHLVARTLQGLWDPHAPERSLEWIDQPTIPRRALAEGLWTGLALADFRRPERAEIRELRRWLQEDCPSRLSLLLALWRGRRRAIREQLATLEEADFADSLRLALRLDLASPATLLTGSRVAQAREIILPWVRRDPRDVPGLARRLLQLEQGAALASLTECVPALSFRSLLQLAWLAFWNRQIPRPFAEAVFEQLARRGGSLWIGALLSWLRQRPA